jgi:hypothetical protein
VLYLSWNVLDLKTYEPENSLMLALRKRLYQDEKRFNINKTDRADLYFFTVEGKEAIKLCKFLWLKSYYSVSLQRIDQRPSVGITANQLLRTVANHLKGFSGSCLSTTVTTCIIPSAMKRHLSSSLPEELFRFESVSTNITSPQPHNPEITVEDEPNFSDVESAISLILTRIPSNTTYPRIIFKHQLYPILQNQTEIETEIETLRINNRIRLLVLPNSFIAIIFHSDYVSDIQKSITQIECSDIIEQHRNRRQEIISSLQKFIRWLPTSTKTSILESDLKTVNGDMDPLLTQADLVNLVEQGYLFPHRSSNASGLYYLSHHQVSLNHHFAFLLLTLFVSLYFCYSLYLSFLPCSFHSSFPRVVISFMRSVP